MDDGCEMTDEALAADKVASMLVAQMELIHKAVLLTTARLDRAKYDVEKNWAARCLSSLAKSFAMQAEVLRGYRTGSRQTIRVERVTIVNDGGRAIVGAGSQRGGGEKLAEQRHGQQQITHSPAATVPHSTPTAIR